MWQNPYFQTGEYSRTPREHRWLFDKLLLAETLGYSCGPVGEEVPYPGWYCLRPIYNINGMSEGASIEWIDCSTDHFPAGYFWCERFRGPHISVDYLYGHPVLCVEGLKEGLRFVEWVKRPLGRYEGLPEPILESIREIKYANVEYIGGKAIEVNLHHNADFQWGNTRAIPVYDRQRKPPPGMKFVAAADGARYGLFID